MGPNDLDRTKDISMSWSAVTGMGRASQQVLMTSSKSKSQEKSNSHPSPQSALCKNRPVRRCFTGCISHELAVSSEGLVVLRLTRWARLWACWRRKHLIRCNYTCNYARVMILSGGLLWISEEKKMSIYYCMYLHHWRITPFPETSELFIEGFRW